MTRCPLPSHLPPPQLIHTSLQPSSYMVMCLELSVDQDVDVVFVVGWGLPDRLAMFAEVLLGMDVFCASFGCGLARSLISGARLSWLL